MSSSLAVVSSHVEAVFSFDLVIQSSALGKHDLGVSRLTIEQNDLERQVGAPFVRRVAAYLI